MKRLPTVSVIIPTRNSASTIKELLQSIKAQSYKYIETIVVDNNSSDQTKAISLKFTTKVYNIGPERSAQRNFGAKKAKGAYLLFVDSDMILSKKVVAECVKLAQENEKFGGITIPEISIGKSFWAKCKALERSFYWGVDWIEAPRFFSLKIFKDFKGYDEKQTGTEDYDLPQRIKTKLGTDSILRIKDVIYHNEGNLALFYTLKKKYYYVKTSTVYRNQLSNKAYFTKQSSIIERYKLFFSDPKKLFKNPVIGAGMLFMKSSEFVAGGLGVLFKK